MTIATVPLAPEGAPRAHPQEEVLGWLEHLELRRRGMDATRLRLIAAAVDQAVGAGSVSGAGSADGLADRALRAEIATALDMSEHQAEAQMDLAFRLAHQYDETLGSLERGELSAAHARVVVDAGILIGAGTAEAVVERRRSYERETLEVARRETPNRLRPIAHRLAEHWAERPLEERHQEAVSARRITVLDREDGMADLIAHLPAVEAHAIKDRLTRIARAAERGERTVRGERNARGGKRTRDQIRADALADLLLSADERTLFAGSTAESVRAQVQIAVDAEFPSGGAGELLGYGPIDAETARCLAGSADRWESVVIDSASGEVLAVDRYRPSAEMRRRLGARDRHCRFPGCRVPVSRCDIDHTVDAALGGETSTANLAHLCRGHHTLKHHTDWRVAQDSGGGLLWTSPTGRVHVDRPPGAVGRASPVSFST